ncbi:hypothetical protein [Streptomyces sp. SPB074]|uniref:hypothetical protein n=1 Tax=Streptomyces sp. (strain SPB074) TaxID=465543 RepID=UPI00017F0E5E|nr:hypothetical protein [Streptomyces sp. SPB074]EFG65596.1 conserved hypothetical protein [Streptomyces sp. SPB074]
MTTTAPRPLIVGVCPRLSATGYAGEGWTAYAQAKKIAGQHRLSYLLAQTMTYVRRADLVALEGPDTRTGHWDEEIAGLRIMIQQELWRRGVPCAVVPAAAVARYAAGRSHAARGEIRSAVRERYRLEPEGPARYVMSSAVALWAMAEHHYVTPPAPVDGWHARALSLVRWPTLPPRDASGIVPARVA